MQDILNQFPASLFLYAIRTIFLNFAQTAANTFSLRPKIKHNFASNFIWLIIPDRREHTNSCSAFSIHRSICFGIYINQKKQKKKTKRPKKKQK